MNVVFLAVGRIRQFRRSNYCGGRRCSFFALLCDNIQKCLRHGRKPDLNRNERVCPVRLASSDDVSGALKPNPIVRFGSAYPAQAKSTDLQTCSGHPSGTGNARIGDFSQRSNPGYLVR